MSFTKLSVLCSLSSLSNCQTNDSAPEVDGCYMVSPLGLQLTGFDDRAALPAVAEHLLFFSLTSAFRLRPSCQKHTGTLYFSGNLGPPNVAFRRPCDTTSNLSVEQAHMSGWRLWPDERTLCEPLGFFAQSPTAVMFKARLMGRQSKKMQQHILLQQTV